MKYFICVLLILISGCSTVVPVTAKFPEAPEKIQNNCPQLVKLKDEAKLSDVSKTVILNYSTYYECAVKVESWIEWYQVNKIIFEGIK
jgi:uncharacterized protein YceK